MKAILSCGVWKRPWPNLELVSMNLSLIFSRAFLLVWTRRDLRRVSTRFLGPMQQPCGNSKSKSKSFYIKYKHRMGNNFTKNILMREFIRVSLPWSWWSRAWPPRSAGSRPWGWWTCQPDRSRWKRCSWSAEGKKKTHMNSRTKYFGKLKFQIKLRAQSHGR